MKTLLNKYLDVVNEAIFERQQQIGGVYGKYFTLYVSLSAALISGSFFGFTGDDCYGKIPFDSPVFWTLLLAALFFFFQTFVLVQLTIGRIVRLLTVAVCGHYLSYQAYGIWSQNNVELLERKISTLSYTQTIAMLDSIPMMEAINGVGVCKPFALANVAYGHIWINLPALVIILVCFFVGTAQKEIEE